MLLGPSGCGKSTLLKLMAGFFPPSHGEISVVSPEGAREVVTGPGVDRGVVFQQPTLFPWLSVRDNVLAGARFTGKESQREEGEKLLDIVGLSDFADSYPHELSGGMQQRAQIARVLATSPQTVLMDEPFGALDPFTREQLQAELLGVWQRYRPTIVFVTHSVEEALLLGHRIIVLAARPGRVIHDVAVPEGLRASEVGAVDGGSGVGAGFGVGEGSETSADAGQEERLRRIWEVTSEPEFVELRRELSAAVHRAHGEG
ncbi:ABC transporter ATP-binding protein [Corynebacterium lowii]|uniref:Taurine import ATP-binding protein TauB n=1 Tax=Corynebacterium lowii TaxID=1544413 RepID=A0A0Q1AJL8_9CORY|nr:ABC transporter ATP-binding protein [Corynebacterium lowii]KQB87051.1 Taurine import ATP-binding protein TauB [Corynebacterium lowii]MDP9852367.1 NitT/TauT family transport system ATP-binding protein/taurine transport system ATP-binding protein [Corynebacterium lowii]